MKAAFTHHAGEFTLDAAFSAPDKGFTALFGPSGSGKTTMLRLIAGLIRAPRGYFEVNGHVWQDEAPGIFVPPHRRRIGYVFQDSRLFGHLTVRGNLYYGYRRAAGRRLDPDHVVGQLDLGGLLERYPAQLSGGQKQRVGIGRALLTSPSLMLFDEPLASLDDEGKREILAVLERLHDRLEIPAIYVSHSVEEVGRLADTIALISQGRVTACGPAGEIATRLDLPLARDEGALAIVTAVVESHDDAYGLTYLTFPGGIITAPRWSLPPGSPARVGVHARDVSLALSRPEGISLLNVFPGVVTGVAPVGPSSALVSVAVGNGAVLLSRVTRKSVDALALAPGRHLYAMVKGVALAR